VPRGEQGALVVWRLGDALLAVPLHDVDEVVGVDPAGLARAREGPLELRAPPGLELPAASHQAVVVGGGEAAPGSARPKRMALAADEVEGVYGSDEASSEAPPTWLGEIGSPHLASLVRLQDGRVAAALDVGALFRAT
jgi:chemotaxis signal transduction protein